MELKDFIKIVRDRWWLVVAVAALLTVATVAFSLLLPKVYKGEAKVLVSQQNTGAALFGQSQQDSSLQERDLATQVRLMTTAPVAQSVIDSLRLKTTPDELLKTLTVTADGQTNVVTIDATAGTARGAADIANGLANAFIAQSRDIKRQSINTAATQVQKSLDDAQKAIITLEATVAKGVAVDATKSQLETTKGLYNTLADKLQQLQISAQLETGSGTIVASAVPDPNPIAPSPLRNGGIALVVGLALGMGTAFLADALDSTITSSEQAEEIYAAPVLARIPEEKFEDGERRRLTVLMHPNSPASESYRNLRNNLHFINFEHDIKTLMVTSAEPGEGKSTVAANLAAVLSQAGWSVILVVCDFRRPTTAEFFDVDNTVGLSEVLSGAKELSDALQKPSSLENLQVLTAGRMPPNPSELLGSATMASLIKRLRESANWIIVDTPPLLAVADAAAAVQFADGVLVTVKGGISTRDAARRGKEHLDQVGARIVGVTVLGIGQESSSLHYSGYSDDAY